MKKNTCLSLCIVAFLTLFATPAFADYQTPTFPLCSNPQGSVIASYDTGSHAIAGQMSLQEGKDTVYKLDESLNQVTQCYCPPTELNGIQTNWLQASEVSEEEKQQLLANGWVFIENGSTWGLANTAYVAQNISYACNETGASTPPPSSPNTSPSITAVVQSANATNTSSSNASASSLPNTGGSVELLEIIGVGILSIFISFLLKKRPA